jgi:serine/threonine protein kinase
VTTLEIDIKHQRKRSFSDPMIGRKLLHYRVVEKIGQGGMSVVYRGKDEILDRAVAIKVLHPFLAHKNDCRERLAREARLVARLQHPNILEVFDYSEEAPLPEQEDDPDVEQLADVFLVSEFVDGVTLRDFAEEYALAELPELGCMIIWQLALALSHAHKQGVIHRDLKPENIMIRRDGTLKLMDFGISRATESNQLTVTGTLLGFCCS